MTSVPHGLREPPGISLVYRCPRCGVSLTVTASTSPFPDPRYCGPCSWDTERIPMTLRRAS